MAKKIRKVGVDGGNGETKMMFEDVAEGLSIPTATTKVLADYSDGEFLSFEEVTPENMHKHLDITYVSSKALKETNKRYYVGHKTLTQTSQAIKETEEDAKKYENEIVVRTVLAGLLVDAVRQNPNKKSIKATYDLALALPLNSINQEAFRKNSERFIGTHEMIFHYPNGDKIEVKIDIEFATTLPEAVIGSYALIYDRQNKLKKYTVNEDDEKKNITLENRPLLLCDIGAGTFDLAVMNGVNFDYKNSKCEVIGSKKSIENICSEWNKKINKEWASKGLDKINSLLEFNEIYSNPENYNYKYLEQFSQDFLREDAEYIAFTINQVRKKLPARTRIFIFGGGQLLYKTLLLDFAKKYGFLDNSHFVTNPVFVNAEGLLIYAMSKSFESLKKRYYEALNV